MFITEKENLDLKKTIETTLENAKGWSFANYPSVRDPNKKIQIDIRYLGESIPTLAGTPLNNQDILQHPVDYSKKPVYVHFRLGKADVILQHNSFIDSTDNREKDSYSFFIRAGNGAEYRAVECPDGSMVEKGNKLLLWAVKKDQDFGHYISFVLKNEKLSDHFHSEVWQLSKMMANARRQTSR